MASMPEVEIFTDGACSGNPGPGGWGAILRSRGVEKELAGAWRVEPGEDLHQRRLAGAVVADDAEHFAALQLQADGIERGDRAEILRYPLCFEERSAGMVNRRRFHGAPLPWFA